MKKKRVLSLLLSLITLFTSVNAVFAQSSDSVNVYVVAQAYGAFLAPPQEITVSKNTAEDYGYSDSVDGVSVLDVLVKVHELIFEDMFTADTKSEFLSLSGDFVTKIFGEETYSSGFLLNEGYPNDGTTGTMVTTQSVESGDKLDFFIYQDVPYCTDKYSWIDYDFSDDEIQLSAVGSAPAYAYAYTTPSAFKQSATPLVDVNFAWVDENGGCTEIENITTDENGMAQIPKPTQTNKDYYLTVIGIDRTSNSVLMNPVKIDFSSKPTDKVSVTGIDVKSELSMCVGDKADVTYSVLPENAADKSVTVTSSDESVVSVDGEELSALKIGEAEITVRTTDGGFFGKCTVTVEEDKSAENIMHAIAQKYSCSDMTKDGNLIWFLTDISAYNELYEDKAEISDKLMRAYLDIIIANADTKNSAVELSKSIIVLRALGYDVTNVTTADRRVINVAQKLDELIKADDKGVKNIYTLPYVIIAAEASGLETSALVDCATENSSSWMNTDYGTDAATFMLAAIAPYYTTDEAVKKAVDKAVPLVTETLKTNSFSNNAASAGLAVAAFSSLGINADEQIKMLMTFAADTEDGFTPLSNSFSTEQGFRGLVAWQLSAQKGKKIFDFSNRPKKKAEATWALNCPVSFEVIPSDATVTVKDNTPMFGNSYDLDSGEYEYTIEKDGYITKSGKITVTDEEAAGHTPKKINVSLISKPSSGSSKVSVNVSVMVHDENICNGEFSYKNNAKSYTVLAQKKLSLSAGQTAFDALDMLLKESGIDYVEKTVGYISRIGDYEEFGHGPNSGWMLMVDGKNAEVGCREIYLRTNSKFVWFYTDDYILEKGSEKWTSSGGSASSSTKYTVKFSSSGSVSNTVKVNKDSSMSEPSEPKKDGYIFEGWYKDKDYKEKFDFSEKITSDITLYAKWTKCDGAEIMGIDSGSKFYDNVLYAYEKGYIKGTEKGFEADLTMTRAMICEMLHRIEQNPNAKLVSYLDMPQGAWYENSVSWATENGIIKGITEDILSPEGSLTREQLAAIIYRYALYKGYDVTEKYDLSGLTDVNEISEYALDAMEYAYAVGVFTANENGEVAAKSEVTRAEAISSVVTFLKNNL